MVNKPEPAAVRLDKWLWAARFFKTRSLAAAAVKSGRVEVNGAKAKPAKTVAPGDAIRLRRGTEAFVLTVMRLSIQRGSAETAGSLYIESEESIRQREAAALQRKAAAAVRPKYKGRPGKRDRRALAQLKYKG